MGLFQNFVSIVIKLIYESTDPYKISSKTNLTHFCNVLYLEFYFYCFILR